jgi:tetratricopeptide (TPR) repeat protein
MPGTRHITVSALAVIAAILLTIAPSAAEEDFLRLQVILKLANLDPEVAKPKDQIYFKNDIAYCTGASDLAMGNNAAAEKMERGDWAGAAAQLEKTTPNASLFFPFRYNLGTCYLYLNQLKKSMLHYQKAQAVVPEYWGTYIQIGSIYQRWYRDNEAIESYRQALRWKRNELNTYVLIGDLFFNRGHIQLAKKYYDQSLRINNRFNNGILGRAKIFFREGEFYKALVTLKSIDTRENFDKSYHYYYAETAFKLQDYETASAQYTQLLKYRTDRFFLTNSAALIEHKLELSNRFAEKIIQKRG